MKTYEVKIEGTTPMLMNRPNQEEISDKSKTAKRETNTNEEKAAEKLYTDSEGRVYIPSTWIRGSLVEAGKQKKMGGKGNSKSNYSKPIGAGVSVEPFELILKPAKWDTFSILAVNPTTKGRNLLSRPRFKEWGVSFDIVFDEEQIEPAVLKEVIDIAGRIVGVGDWRPAKKGPFGKFQVTLWREKS
jgi:hypothetical protein